MFTAQQCTGKLVDIGILASFGIFFRSASNFLESLFMHTYPQRHPLIRYAFEKPLRSMTGASLATFPIPVN